MINVPNVGIGPIVLSFSLSSPAEVEPKKFVTTFRCPMLVALNPPRFSNSRIRWPVGDTSVRSRSEIRGCLITTPTLAETIVAWFGMKIVLFVTASSGSGVREFVGVNGIGSTPFGSNINDHVRRTVSFWAVGLKIPMKYLPGFSGGKSARLIERQSPPGKLMVFL